MNLNQLVYFWAVGHAGNYSRAAEQCGVSEPLLYRSVRSFERACGTKLLERRGNRVALTASGGAIFEYAAQIASLRGLAEEALAAQIGAISGSLAIGAGTNTASHLLPSVLANWRREHPAIHLSILLGSTQELQQLLLKDEIDVLLGSGTEWAAGLRKELIFSDSTVVVCGPGHRLEQFRLVSIRELSSEALVLQPSGSSTREEMEQIESQHGVRFTVAVEVNREDVIKQLCRARLGIAILPRSVVAEELDNKSLSVLNVEGFPRSRPYFLVQRLGRESTPQLRSLLAAVRSWVRTRNF